MVVLYVYNIILTFFYHPRDKKDMEAREICRQDKKNSGIDNFAMNWERLSRGIICVRKVWNKKQGFQYIIEGHHLVRTKHKTKNRKRKTSCLLENKKKRKKSKLKEVEQPKYYISDLFCTIFIMSVWKKTFTIFS